MIPEIINHPKSNELVLIRKHYVLMCDGDKCAAALVAYFEYNHRLRLREVERYPDSPLGLWQEHSISELVKDLFSFSRNSILKCLSTLEELGIIKVEKAAKRGRRNKYLFNHSTINFYLQISGKIGRFFPLNSPQFSDTISKVLNGESSANLDYPGEKSSPNLDQQVVQKRTSSSPNLDQNQSKFGLPLYIEESIKSIKSIKSNKEEKKEVDENLNELKNEDSQSREKESPSIEIPFKEFIPENLLKNQDFLQVWIEWNAYRKSMRKKISEMGAKRQLNMLAKYTPEIAIETIERSITNDWQGLFPERVVKSKPLNQKFEPSNDLKNANNW